MSSGDAACGPRTGSPACLGTQVEFPDDPAGVGVEGVHAPLHAFVVAAGDAQKNQAVPGDWGGGERFSDLFGSAMLVALKLLAGLEIVGQDPAIVVASEKAAVQAPGGAARGAREGLAAQPTWVRQFRRVIGSGSSEKMEC